MAMERHFLGWDGPALPAACAWLMARYATVESASMHGVLVVLPGGRAGRRLMELLVDAAEERGVPLVPPRITTAGGLADHLVTPDRPNATPEQRQLAWMQALRTLEPLECRALLPSPPDAQDVPAWAALAAEVERLHKELIGEDVTIADVARKLRDELAREAEHHRWNVLVDVHRAYLDILKKLKLTDPQASRWQALHAEKVATQRDIVVVGAVDLNTLQRRLLDAVADRVSILVHAPESEADRFDAHGCLVIERWTDATLDLDDATQLAVVQRPIDQASAVVRAIDKLDGAYPAEQITVGVCDEEVTPYLQQMLPGYDLPVRYAGGTPMERCGPVRLLAVAADYLEHRRFTDFAALIRHPDMKDWLLAHGGRGDSRLTPDQIDSWITLMDRYYADHLQRRLTGYWLGPPERRARLKAVHDAVHHDDLLGGLTGGPRELSVWAEPVAQLLISVYGREKVDRTSDAGRAVIESCEAIRDVLAEYRKLDRCKPINARMSAADALRLVVGRVAGGEVPPEPVVAAIEMLGPLELPLDDADVLIVTGFNEGRLPASIQGDALLPNGLRESLRIEDNARRYARDLYAVSTMVRSKRVVRFVAGRRDAQGDPLRPSRLMFAAPPDVIARRVRRFFGDDEQVTESPVSSHPVSFSRMRPAERSGFVVPPPLRFKQPLEYMRVTDFAAFIACPYRYALGRVLRLRTVGDDAAEMDGMAFGSFAHEVLDRFAATTAAHSDNADVVWATLRDLMETVRGETFGNESLPAVHVQLKQMEDRLRAFAAWQAGHVAEGWRIRYSELSFRDEQAGWLNFEDGSPPMKLHGQIDRIDFNERTGEWAVLDYKTSDAGREPEQTHRAGPRDNREWVDLQLPLYRTLVAEMEDDAGEAVLRAADLGRLKLGYVLLPRDVAKVGAAWAPWTLDQLREAEDLARAIVQRIRLGMEDAPDGRHRFEPTDTPPRERYDDFAWVCGVGQLQATPEADDTDADAQREAMLFKDDDDTRERDAGPDDEWEAD